MGTELLRDRWQASFSLLCLAAPQASFDALLQCYEEPRRAYHTLQHLAECFYQFGQVKDAHSPGAIGIALFFHDAIYDPRASDNEARSAAWAARVLENAGASAETIEGVDRMITATRHDAVPEDHDTRILVDIDLSILGADESRYLEYARQIRTEYSFLDDERYRRGRVAVLQSFLARAAVYNTEFFRARLEQKARSNLARERDALSE